MDYVQTPSKTNIQASTKKLVTKGMKDLSTSYIIWFLVKRHRFALIATWAIIVSALYVFPPLPDLVLSLVGR